MNIQVLTIEPEQVIKKAKLQLKSSYPTFELVADVQDYGYGYHVSTICINWGIPANWVFFGLEIDTKTAPFSSVAKKAVKQFQSDIKQWLEENKNVKNS